MALMTRFFQIDANPERSVFTFLVTKAVSKEGSKGVSSKDFWFGFHKWSMLFTNANKVSLSFEFFVLWSGYISFSKCYPKTSQWEGE